MYYIGFDLGDGESCLCWCNDALTAAVPEIIPITQKASFTTAVATMRETGQTVIGTKVIPDAPTLTDIRVCFKRDFKQDKGDVYESFRRFISGVLSELRKAELPFDIDDTAQCRFVIGQPADWDNTTLNRYKKLLESCGIYEPYMVSESRAALVFLNTAKFMQAYDPVGMSTLVCDFGSSTLDFAYCADGKNENVTVFGDPRLGGGLLDEQIVLESIRMISNPQEREAAAELFTAQPDVRARLMMKARTLKEKFFSDPNASALSERLHLFRPGLQALTITVSQEIISAAIMNPQPLLDGNSFYQQLQNQVEKALEITKNSPPKIVALTGGASRMAFFREICEDVFRPCGANIVFSNCPDKDIACGLALDGKYLAKLERLRDELRLYAQSEKTETIIAALMPELIHELSAGIMELLLDDENNACSIRQSFRTWRHDEKPLSLNDLKEMIEKEVVRLSGTDKFSGLIEEKISEWMHGVFEKVQNDLDEICLRIGLSPAHVRLDRIRLTEPVEIAGTVISPGATLLDTLDFIVTAVTAIVIGGLAGGGGIALVCSGPIGIAVGALLVGTLHLILGNQAKDVMMRTRIAKPVRWAIPEVSIFNPQNIRKMSEALEKELSEKSGINNQIQQSLAMYIDTMVDTIACQTRVS